MNKKITLLAILPTLLCTACATTKSSDITRYNELLDSCRDSSDFHTELYIFPESLDIGTPVDFFYKTTKDLFTGSFLFYLVMDFDETKFNAELNRISQIEACYNEGTVKRIIPYESESIYLTINKDNRYEYVKYNEKTMQIAYISNQLYSWNDTKVAQEYYLPELTIPEEIDDGDNSYNLYYRYVNEGNITVGYYIKD